MKRYLLFSGVAGMPLTGFESFDGDFDSVDEARAFVEKEQADMIRDGFRVWAQIVDTRTLSIDLEMECADRHVTWYETFRYGEVVDVP